MVSFLLMDGREYINYRQALTLVYPEGTDNVERQELEPKAIFSKLTRVQFNAGAKNWAKVDKIEALKEAYTNLFKHEIDLLLLLRHTQGLHILFMDKDKVVGCGYL